MMFTIINNNLSADTTMSVEMYCKYAMIFSMCMVLKSETKWLLSAHRSLWHLLRQRNWFPFLQDY